MADVQLTTAQRAVVENRGGSLLVSAAAGSGKTKVLVDRLMAQICGEESQVNIDDFLIITYTKAAAAELRLKIASELSARLAKNPENRHLQRQTTRVYLAQISTVHSFCTNILRQYAHLLDLPADFRVAEEQESTTLRQTAVQLVLDQAYKELDAHPDRRELIDRLGHGRDDRRLDDLLLKTYNAARCQVSPEAWMEACKKAYDFAEDTTAAQTPWGAYLIGNFRKALTAAENDLETALRLMLRDAAIDEKLRDLYENNLRTLKAYDELESWDQLYEKRTITFNNLKQVKKCQDKDLLDRVINLRKGALDDIRKALVVFYAPDRQVMEDLRSTAAPIRGLMELVSLFDRCYGKEKERRRILDFSDLEHTAIRLLRDPYSGQPTAAAKELSQRYREILVDEYQDSNAVQECIFDAVSRDGQNRFSVGDVKQSIYRFRLADPGIFLNCFEQYVPYRDAKDGQPRKILLSENFRSRKEILWAANDVFSLVMRKEAAELDYTPDVALVPGREFPPTEQRKVELHLLELEKQSGGTASDKRPEEAAYVAARIYRLLREQTPVTDGNGTRPIRPGDIAILMRSPGGSARDYIGALAKYGIPCVSEKGGNILDSTEVLTLISLLHVLDDPHQDIPLAAVLSGPVFDLSPDELARMRAGRREGDLYDCLLAASGENEKLGRFVNWLTRMRQRATWLTLEELLDEVLLSTHLEEVFSALPDGMARQAKLEAFRRLIRANSGAYGGDLLGLCVWLDSLEESGVSVAPPSAETVSDAVQICSVHKSKGLEYPVVFLCDLSRKFNLTDNSLPVLTEQELLIGTHVIDPKNRAWFPGIAHTAIAEKRRRQLVAEEQRILYVAMTRAKDMLIMSYCGKDVTPALIKLNEKLTVPLRPEVAANVTCIGDWVLLAALCRTEAGALFERTGPNEYSRVHDDVWQIDHQIVSPTRIAASEEPTRRDGKNAPDCASMEAALHFQYPHAAAVRLPSKLTATQLKGRLLDQEAAQEAPLPQSSGTYRRPSFRRDGPLSGREKGNATHLFMQYVRYAACTSLQGIEEELERMLLQRFLTARQSQAVDRQQILRLFQSTFGQRILQAKEVVREFKFSILTDAAEYAPSVTGEELMLQGVVDCFWQEAEGLVIVDFKTDRLSGGLAERGAHYAPQLRAYAKALSRIYGLPVKDCYLYFFEAGEETRIDEREECVK